MQKVEDPGAKRRGTVPALLLGLASFCFYIGYFAHAQIIETIINKMHENIDSSIDKHAGYTAQSVQFAVFALGCFIAPSVIDLIGSKRSIVLCSALFVCFYSGFLHFNIYYFYISHALVGFAYGLFNGAEGVYVAEHSTEQSVGWTLSIETTLSHLGLLGAGVVLFFSRFLLPYIGEEHPYSETHIKMLYSTYCFFGLVSLVLSCLLPNKIHPTSLAAHSSKKKMTIKDRLAGVVEVMKNPLALIYLPVMFHQGLFIAFGVSVYPSSFGFDARLADKAAWLVVIYCFFAGVGIILGGAIVAAGCRKFKSFSLIPTMIIHFFVLAVFYVMIFVSCPSEVFYQPTNIKTLVEPGYVFVAISAAITGIGDCTITTSRGAICQKMIPGKRDEMYSLTRLFQAFFTAGMLAVTSHLRMEVWIILQVSFALLAVFCFFVCLWMWKRERKIRDSSTEPKEMTPSISESVEKSSAA